MVMIRYPSCTRPWKPGYWIMHCGRWSVGTLFTLFDGRYSRMDRDCASTFRLRDETAISGVVRVSRQPASQRMATPRAPSQYSRVDRRRWDRGPNQPEAKSPKRGRHARG